MLIILFQTAELHVRAVRFVHTQQILGQSLFLISQIVSFKCNFSQIVSFKRNLLIQLWNLLDHDCLSSCPIARLHVWSPVVGFLQCLFPASTALSCPAEPMYNSSQLVLSQWQHKLFSWATKLYSCGSSAPQLYSSAQKANSEISHMAQQITQTECGGNVWWQASQLTSASLPS